MFQHMASLWGSTCNQKGKFQQWSTIRRKPMLWLNDSGLTLCLWIFWAHLQNDNLASQKYTWVELCKSWVLALAHPPVSCGHYSICILLGLLLLIRGRRESDKMMPKFPSNAKTPWKKIINNLYSKFFPLGWWIHYNIVYYIFLLKCMIFMAYKLKWSV